MHHVNPVALWREECGIVGIWQPDGDVVSPCYLALFALQHRGQEGAGIAVTDGMHIDIHKGAGLLTEIFKNGLPAFHGYCAIGHVRYSTVGGNNLANIQPLLAYDSSGMLSIAHNGSLTNAQEIRQTLEEQGSVFQSSSDSEVILNLIARSTASSIEEKVISSVAQIEGAYCLVVMTGDKLIGIRDPLGFRPLCLGQLDSGGYVIASETCALDAINATFIRDIAPGEMVVITKNGLTSRQFATVEKKNVCIFEYIYFARPDSNIDGQNVWQTRFRLGQQLAKAQHIDADIVVPVPDTGIAAAIGYSAESGTPYAEGLIKNRYVGRTFILPEQNARTNSVNMKLSPVKANLVGKRVILIDDSIVRGTTSARIITLLREAGAKEVHMCVSSPPITHPCYYGIDTSIRDDLIAAKTSESDICKMIGADSLHYLAVNNLLCAVNDPHQNKMCLSCFNGCYPTDITQCLGSAHKSSCGKLEEIN